MNTPTTYVRSADPIERVIAHYEDDDRPLSITEIQALLVGTIKSGETCPVCQEVKP